MNPFALARSILLVVMVAGATPPGAARAGTSAMRAQRAAPRPGFGALPARFEINRGQVDGRVRFLERGAGSTLFLTANAAVVATTDNAAVRLRYAGANPHPGITGVDRLPGTVNYFLGADRARWRADVPTYARVEYRNVYPGIDLAFHGAPAAGGAVADASKGPGSLPSAGVEYDWILHPGASVSRIRLDVQGAAGIHLDRRGNLVLLDRGVRLVQRLPVVYQTIGGTKRYVSARYTLLTPRHGSDARVGFSIGTHDRARPLIIDPTLVYGTYLGGSNSDGGAGIALDGKGDAYVTGDTLSLDFPIAHPDQRALKSAASCRGYLGTTHGTCVDAFVSKLSADGSTLLYSTFLGGTLDDYGYAIAVDKQGNAYVTGGTLSPDFPVANALQPHFHGGADLGDVFVSKLGPAGDRLLFSTYLGGSGDQDGQGIAMSGDSVYVTGRTNSAAFPLSHPLQSRLGAGTCGYPFHAVGKVRCYATFVSKLSGDGRSLEYSTYLGGNSTAFGWAIAVYRGRAIVAGQTTASNFPVSHAVQQTYGGGRCGVPGQYDPCNDAFVAELARSGQRLLFSTYLGAGRDDIAHGVAVDRAGDVFVAGETTSRHFPTAHALEPRFRGDATMGFVTKLNPAGTGLIYSTYLGGTGVGGDVAYDVAADAAGDAYVVGSTTSTDFPITRAFDGHLAAGGNVQNGFITKINPAGTALLYSSYLGGTDHDLAGSVAVDAAGNAYVTGFATSTDFPTAHPLQRRLTGGTFDAIVAKVGNPGTPPPAGATVSRPVHTKASATQKKTCPKGYQLLHGTCMKNRG